MIIRRFDYPIPLYPQGILIPQAGGGGGGVTSLNAETGDVTITAGAGISVTPSGQNIAIAAIGAGGVSSVGKYGDATVLTGAVKLEQGANCTLTRNDADNSIVIAGTAGGAGEPHIGWNYLIYLSAGVYYARNGRTGALDSSSASLYTLATYCIANLDTYGGKIYFDLDGVQTLSQGLTVPTSGGSPQGVPAYTVTLEGKGRESTVFAPASNQNGIILSSAAIAYLRNFSVKIGGGSSGIGIVSALAGTADTGGLYGRWDNLNINHQGTGWAISINNPYFMQFTNIFIHNYTTSAGGWQMFNENSGNNYGNSQWDEIWISYDGTTAGYKCMEIYGQAGSLTELLFNHVTLVSNPSYGTGIYFNGNVTSVKFNHCDCENFNTCLDASAAVINACEFNFDYASWGYNPNTAFKFSSNCKGNIVRANTMVTLDASLVMWADANVDFNQPNIFEKINVGGYAVPTTGYSGSSSTIYRDIYGSKLPEAKRQFIVSDNVALETGSANNRGVVRLWDYTKSAYYYVYVDNGAIVVSASEPT